MRVENPKFSKSGEVLCHECPLDSDQDDSACIMWWYRNAKGRGLICPTAETYAEACAIADAAKEGE